MADEKLSLRKTKVIAHHNLDKSKPGYKVTNDFLCIEQKPHRQLCWYREAQLHLPLPWLYYGLVGTCSAELNRKLYHQPYVWYHQIHVVASPVQIIDFDNPAVSLLPLPNSVAFTNVCWGGYSAPQNEDPKLSALKAIAHFWDQPASHHDIPVSNAVYKALAEVCDPNSPVLSSPVAAGDQAYRVYGYWETFKVKEVLEWDWDPKPNSLSRSVFQAFHLNGQ